MLSGVADAQNAAARHDTTIQPPPDSPWSSLRLRLSRFRSTTRRRLWRNDRRWGNRRSGGAVRTRARRQGRRTAEAPVKRPVVDGEQRHEAVQAPASSPRPAPPERPRADADQRRHHRLPAGKPATPQPSRSLPPRAAESRGAAGPSGARACSRNGMRSPYGRQRDRAARRKRHRSREGKSDGESRGDRK